MERRYPVILHQFGYRRNSGGQGKYTGGNGVIRDIEFLEEINISLLTERRARAPYGLAGGDDAKTGVNTWYKQPMQKGGKVRKVNLGGKATVKFGPNDRLVLETPGGGGWGRKEERTEKESVPAGRMPWEARGSLAEKAAADAAFGA